MDDSVIIPGFFYLISINVAAADIPSDAVCYKGHYYKVYEYSMSWSEAQSFCKTKGGHLVTITSSSEQRFLETLGCRDRVNYWLGASDAAKEGVWKWVTGEAWNYTNWGDDQPDNSQLSTGIKEDYLQFCVDWGMKWNDSCNEQDWTAGVGFICEWDVTPISKTSISLEKISYVFDGKIHKPKVTIKCNGKNLKKDTDFSLKYIANKWPGTGYVLVTGKGNYSGSIKKYFSINPKKVTGIRVTRPASKQLKISWNSQKSSYVTGYQIQYAKTFGTNKTVKVGGNVNNYVIKKLSSNCNYSIRIRSYATTNGKTAYGTWSSAKTIKTK